MSDNQKKGTDEVEALEAKVAELEKALKAAKSGGGASVKPATSKPVVGLRGGVNNSDEIKASHSKEPVAYRATRDGIDHKQGLIKAGQTFATTQPQGSWMEKITAKEAKEAQASE